MNRGDLYWAELVPRSGSEQAARRPVLLVSHNGFNKSFNWNSLIVIPLTSKIRHQSPTTVFVPVGTANVSKDSLLLGHQITTLDRAKISERIGSLPPGLLVQVEQAILHAIAIKLA